MRQLRHFIKTDKYSHNMPFIKQTTVPSVDYPEEYNSYIGKRTVKMSPDKFLESARMEAALSESRKGKHANARHLMGMSNEEYSGTWMPPEPYMDTKTNQPLRETWKMQSRVDRVKQGLTEGKNIPGLFIEQDTAGRPVGHEGRHRALAAKELGMTEVPVHIMTQRPYSKPVSGRLYGDWDMSKKVVVEDTIPEEFESKNRRLYFP